LLLGAGIAALALSACSGGPGSEEDLVTALTRNDTFSEAEAECIANAVFEEYGDNEDALGLISGASSYDDLTGSEGVEGFGEAFDRIVETCTNTGG
jgi:hypothetical protein